jgi:hypothetical protein
MEQFWVRRVATSLIFIASILGIAPSAFAHKTSYGYLKAEVAGATVSGKLELSVRDFDFAFFDYAFGPAKGDGKPNLAQLRRREPEIDKILLNKISVGARGEPCSLDPGPVALDLRGGEYFMILPFSGRCKPPTEPLQVTYDLMFDVDAQHRAMIDVQHDGDMFSGIITPEAKTLVFHEGTKTLRDTVVAHIVQGAHHIWIGYDHILFLCSLLLPAVLTRMNDKWLPVNDLADASWSIAKVVTAFTLAHSIT